MNDFPLSVMLVHFVAVANLCILYIFFRDGPSWKLGLQSLAILVLVNGGLVKYLQGDNEDG